MGVLVTTKAVSLAAWSHRASASSRLQLLCGSLGSGLASAEYKPFMRFARTVLLLCSAHPSKALSLTLVALATSSPHQSLHVSCYLFNTNGHGQSPVVQLENLS